MRWPEQNQVENIFQGRAPRLLGSPMRVGALGQVMSEHQIRLRGGWEWYAMDRGPESARRVSLPLVRPAERASRVLLVRPFHRPPVDSEREALTLRMERVGGLISASLNGQEIVRPPSGTTKVSVRLDQPLPARNVLVLEVDLPSLLDTAGDESLWGIIALVIQPFGA